MASTTIDAATNNTAVDVPLLDADGRVVAMVNANANNLGRIDARYYTRTGTPRQEGAPGLRYYLNRNWSITPATQPTGTVSLRLYYTAAELSALQAADPAATPATLNATKTPQPCSNVWLPAGSLFVPASANGMLGSNHFVQLETTGFSSFYLHKGTVALPITIEYFRGRRGAATHLLEWKINCTATPSVQVVLERSSDGAGFAAIHTQDVAAALCLEPFSFMDALPLTGKNFYRLRMKEASGEVKFSAIVMMLNGAKALEIVSLAPNPVRGETVLTVNTAKAGKVEIRVMDNAGKPVWSQWATAVAGANALPVNLRQLSAGVYAMIVMNGEGESGMTRFVKQ